MKARADGMLRGHPRSSAPKRQRGDCGEDCDDDQEDRQAENRGALDDGCQVGADLTGREHAGVDVEVGLAAEQTGEQRRFGAGGRPTVHGDKRRVERRRQRGRSGSRGRRPGRPLAFSAIPRPHGAHRQIAQGLPAKAAPRLAAPWLRLQRS